MTSNKTNNSKQGIFVVIAAMFIQLTLGIAYLWTLFQTGITYHLFGGANGPASLIFSILLFLLTIGSVFGGMLARKLNSTRIVVFIGGVILSLGFLLSSFVTANSPWLLLLTYGLMGGVGMGFTYSTTIACAQKWYPHKKGLISGIIVSALGFGGVVFMPIIMLILRAFGEPNINIYRYPYTGGEQTTFWILSIVFLVVCSVGSLFLKHPPVAMQNESKDNLAEDGEVAIDESENKNIEANYIHPLNESTLTDESTQKKPPFSPPIDYSAIQMLKSVKFYLIMFTFFMAVIGGQMIITFISPIERLAGFDNMNLGALALSIGVLVISACNSGGRLLWGIVCDKIGRINTLIILLASSVVLFLLVGLTIGTWTIFIVAALIGLMYGGILSVFPTLTADAFGSKNLATNYGFVLLGFGAGAFASTQIASPFQDMAEYSGNAGDIYPAFIIGAACAAVGVGLMVILKFVVKKKSYPQTLQESIEDNNETIQTSIEQPSE